MQALGRAAGRGGSAVRVGSSEQLSGFLQAPFFVEPVPRRAAVWLPSQPGRQPEPPVAGGTGIWWEGS